MRRVSIAAVFVGFAALGLISAAPEARSAAAVVPINVRIQCDGENVGEFFISSQTARLSKSAGDTANFGLLGNSDVTSVTVQPKDGVAWPFADEPPTFGRGTERTSGAIRDDIEPGRYGYNLLVTCGTTQDVIDPDMDIDP